MLNDYNPVPVEQGWAVIHDLRTIYELNCINVLTDNYPARHIDGIPDASRSHRPAGLADTP